MIDVSDWDLQWTSNPWPVTQTAILNRPARHRAPLRRGGREGKAIASIAAPFWGCPQWNRKKKAFHGAGRWWIVRLHRVTCNDVRNVDKTTFLSRCIDLGQICSISNYKSWWNSELFWYFWDLRSCEGGLKLWCIVGEVVLSTFLSMLQFKRKRLRLPDGWLTKVYKDIVKGYHNENCCVHPLLDVPWQSFFDDYYLIVARK